jgi:MSHA biogenesis protein MshJ
MQLPSLQSALNKLDAVTIRERAMVAVAALAVVAGIWQWLLMQPLDARRSALLSQISALEESSTAAADAIAAANLNDESLRMARELAADRTSLEGIDHALYSETTGLIRPEQMAQVVTDVLRQRGHLTLISLRNDPARPLIVPATTATPGPDAAPPLLAGPYVQTLTLELQGSYLDVLTYLQALEHLPWRFYWTSLDLRSAGYPMNRVTLQLSTLSLDPTWLGVGS